MALRILHVIPTLSAGGAERQISLLAPALADAGASVSVVYCKGGVNLGALERSRVDLLQLPARSHHDPRIIADIRQHIRRWRPNVVQTWILQMDILGGVAALWNRVPYILSERCSSELYGNHWKTKLRIRVAKNSSAIIANSQGGLDYWRNLGYEGPLKLVRNAVAQPVFSPPIGELEMDNAPILLAAGRLSEQKNITVLIDAFAVALERLPLHRALILGDGPLKKVAEKHIQTKAVANRIHLNGHSSAVGYWLRRADAFISASHFEGHPNVVIEAATVGCPLVLSDIRAHREVVDSTAALFAQTSDALGLADQLVRTVQDIPAASERVVNARLAVASLSIEIMAASYLDIYSGLQV